MVASGTCSSLLKQRGETGKQGSPLRKDQQGWHGVLMLSCTPSLVSLWTNLVDDKDAVVQLLPLQKRVEVTEQI